ncbi:MAG: hypothetical protein M0P69_21350 [Bacteroidales bacterium]|nr:hypothetical protein [Bacteroidales bacterium]
MSKEEIEARALGAILEEGVDFTVTVNRPGILHRMQIRPRTRTFVIRPLVLGTLVRISKTLSSMDVISLDGARSEAGIFSAAIDGMNRNMDGLVDVLAAAIHNRESNPPERLRRFLRENLTPKEATALLGIVLGQMGVSDFLGFMVSVNALAITGTKTPAISGSPSEV